MQKNVASQKAIFFAFDATTNLPKTGDAANITPYESLDYGSVTAITDTSMTEMDATNAKGYYICDLTQAETNANTILFSAKSSTSNIVVVGAPSVVQTVPASFVVAPGSSGAILVGGSNAATTISGLTTGALACTTITASGAVAFQSTFSVTTSTALGALSCTTLTASGAVALQSTVGITGAVTLSSTLTTGAVTFNALTVSNNVIVTGTWTQTGATTITGNVAYVNGVFIAGGSQVDALSLSAAAGGSGLKTAGNTTGHGINAIAGGTGFAVRAGGDVTVTSNVNILGNHIVSGAFQVDSMSVTNATTFSGAVTAINAGNDIRGVTVFGGTITSVTTVTGNVNGNVGGSVGSVTGAVGSVTGNVGGNVVGSVASVVAAVATTSNVKRNQALAAFEFLMTNSTTHAPQTLLAVTVTRSIDGGAFAAGTLSAVTEIANGVYAVDFGAGDLNGKVITLQATAAGADTTFERIVTQP